jgi:hypothetical protein
MTLGPSCSISIHKQNKNCETYVMYGIVPFWPGCFYRDLETVLKINNEYKTWEFDLIDPFIKTYFMDMWCAVYFDKKYTHVVEQDNSSNHYDLKFHRRPQGHKNLKKTL